MCLLRFFSRHHVKGENATDICDFKKFELRSRIFFDYLYGGFLANLKKLGHIMVLFDVINRTTAFDFDKRCFRQILNESSYSLY